MFETSRAGICTTLGKAAAYAVMSCACRSSGDAGRWNRRKSKCPLAVAPDRLDAANEKSYSVLSIGSRSGHSCAMSSHGTRLSDVHTPVGAARVTNPLIPCVRNVPGASGPPIRYEMV